MDTKKPIFILLAKEFQDSNTTRIIGICEKENEIQKMKEDSQKYEEDYGWDISLYSIMKLTMGENYMINNDGNGPPKIE